jgi:hypothetical protein
MNLKQYRERLQKMARELRPVLLQGAYEGAERSLEQLRLSTITAGAWASGDFYRGWRAVKGRDGVYVRNVAPHAIWVELGRKPGRFPPIIVIQRWVEAKLQIGGPEARKTAFLIARKIANSGIRGRFILKRAQPMIRRQIQEGMIRAVLGEMKK